MGCSRSSATSEPSALLRKYKLDPLPIGRGAYGQVYRGVDKDNDAVVAVKRINREGTTKHLLEVEIDILRRFCNHESIVHFISCYESCAEVSLVMEFMPGGELFKVLQSNGAYSEEDAAHYVRAIAAALYHLHSNCVAHRDLKPENLLLTHRYSGDLKVCDFGCAKALESQDELMWFPCGTWSYAAPEVLSLKQVSEGSYTLKCDMFSVGVIVYYLLSGYHPFDVDGRASSEELQNNMMFTKWSFDDEAWWYVSTAAQAVVAGLLEGDPANRFSAKQLGSQRWTMGIACFGRLSVSSSFTPGSHTKFAAAKGGVQFRSHDTFLAYGATHQLQTPREEEDPESCDTYTSARSVIASAKSCEDLPRKGPADTDIRKSAKVGKRPCAKAKAGKDEKIFAKLDTPDKDKRQCSREKRPPSKERHQSREKLHASPKEGTKIAEPLHIESPEEKTKSMESSEKSGLSRSGQTSFTCAPSLTMNLMTSSMSEKKAPSPASGKFDPWLDESDSSGSSRNDDPKEKPTPMSPGGKLGHVSPHEKKVQSQIPKRSPKAPASNRIRNVSADSSESDDDVAGAAPPSPQARRRAPPTHVSSSPNLKRQADVDNARGQTGDTRQGSKPNAIRNSDGFKNQKSDARGSQKSVVLSQKNSEAATTEKSGDGLSRQKSLALSHKNSESATTAKSADGLSRQKSLALNHKTSESATTVKSADGLSRQKSATKVVTKQKGNKTPTGKSKRPVANSNINSHHQPKLHAF